MCLPWLLPMFLLTETRPLRVLNELGFTVNNPPTMSLRGPLGPWRSERAARGSTLGVQSPGIIHRPAAQKQTLYREIPTSPSTSLRVLAMTEWGNGTQNLYFRRIFPYFIQNWACIFGYMCYDVCGGG